MKRLNNPTNIRFVLVLFILTMFFQIPAIGEDLILDSDQEGAQVAPAVPAFQDANDGAGSAIAEPGSTGKAVAKLCGGFLSGLFNFFRNIFAGIFNFLSSIFGGGGGGGGIFGGGGGFDGGGGGGGFDGGTNGGDPGGDGNPAGTPTDVPAEKASLVSQIREKFGVSMRDGSASWSVKSLQAVYKALSVLPDKFKKWNRTMTCQSYRGGLLGMGEVGGGNIWIYGGAFSNGSSGIGTIVHEITHNFQGNRAVMNAWNNQFWPGGNQRSSSVSDYGNTNQLEDMAETVRVYYTNGSWLKNNDPARYEFVKTNIMDGKEF